MDPFQTSLSCFSALQTLYEVYDDAEYTFENAQRLMKTCDVLEVTMNMIPRRTTADQVLAETDNVEIKDDDDEGVKSDSIKLEVDIPSRKEVEEPGMEVCLPIICGGKGAKNLFEDEGVRGKKTKSNGAILNELRASGSSDLDITYAGIAFLISSATEVIVDATQVFSLAKKPNMSWFLTPWKFLILKELEEDLTEQLANLLNFTQQLQAAINVASYAVQMQSLENALDATSVLSHPSMKKFWKQRIGIDKTRASIKEIYEAFLDDQEESIDRYYSSNKFLTTKKNGKKIDPQIAIRRFLGKEWNPNGDDVVTVYELAKLSNELIEKQMKLNSGIPIKEYNLVHESFKECIADEKALMKMIQFNAFQLQYSLDMNGNYINGEITQVKKRNILNITPFSRINSVVTVPQFDKDLHQYDCVTVMKYSEETPPLNHRFVLNKQQHQMAEVPLSRTYLNKDVNRRMYGKDMYKWNAPSKNSYSKDNNSQWKEEFGFRGEDNFQKLPKPILEEDSNGNTPVGRKREDLVQKLTSIMYTPLFMNPGWYTIRYCLEDIETKNSRPHPREFKTSEKSYYYNRLQSTTSTAGKDNKVHKDDNKFKSDSNQSPLVSGAGGLSGDVNAKDKDTAPPRRRSYVEKDVPRRDSMVEGGNRRGSLADALNEDSHDERIQSQMGQGSILIHVKDANAMVWAEKDQNIDSDEGDEDDEEEGGTGGGINIYKNWRPKAPVSFPIHPGSQTKARFYEEEVGYYNEDEKALLAFYVHTEKERKMKKDKSADKKEKELNSPLEIGYFVSSNSNSDDNDNDDESVDVSITSDINDEDEDDEETSRPSSRMATTGRKPTSRIPLNVDLDVPEVEGEEGEGKGKDATNLTTATSYTCKWTMKINKDRQLHVLDIHSLENKLLKDSLIVQTKNNKAFFAFVKPTGKLHSSKGKGGNERNKDEDGEEEEKVKVEEQQRLQTLEVLPGSPQLEYYKEEMCEDDDDISNGSSSWGLSDSDEDDMWSDDDEDEEDDPADRDCGDVEVEYTVGEAVYYYFAPESGNLNEGWEAAEIRARREKTSKSEDNDNSDDEEDNDSPIRTSNENQKEEKYVYDVYCDGEEIKNVSAKDLFKAYKSEQEVELQLQGKWVSGIILDENVVSWKNVHKIYLEVGLTDDCEGQREFYEELLEEDHDSCAHIKDIRPKTVTEIEITDKNSPEYPIGKLEPLKSFVKQELLRFMEIRGIPGNMRLLKDTMIERLREHGKNIDTCMSQANCSRAEAVSALKKNNGDVVNAIMELSSSEEDDDVGNEEEEGDY